MATLSVVFRAVLSWGDHGINHPDEIFQGLEPAHWLVFGYGLLPWEYIDGARTWVLPGLIASVMAVAGISSQSPPDLYLTAIRVLFLAIAGATTYGVFRLARALGAGPAAGLAGSCAFAFAGPIAYFGHRPISESASALAIILGLALAAEASSARASKLWIGTSLLGLAVVLRLQSVWFCVGLLALLVHRRRFREAIAAAVIFGAWAVGLGVLDWLTWGHPFQSAVTYLTFNVAEGRSALFGVAPMTWYASLLLGAMPAVALLLFTLSIASWRRAPVLLITAVTYVAVLSLIPHKESRFLLPVAPVFAALAAVGVTEIGRRLSERWARLAAALLIVAAISSGVTARSLSEATVTGGSGRTSEGSAWDNHGSINRLLLLGSMRSDVCGLKVDGVPLYLTGGYSYFHRRVPLYGEGGPPRERGRYNFEIRLIADDAIGASARDGEYALVKVAAACEPDPLFRWRLPPDEALRAALPVDGPRSAGQDRGTDHLGIPE